MSVEGNVSTHPNAKSEFSVVSKSANKPKKKSPRVTLRFSEEEYARLKLAADGVSLSAYVRGKLFGENVSLRKTRSRVPVLDQQVLAQILGKLGQTDISSNMNQIAYEANCGSLLLDEQTEQEIKLACAHIAWIRVTLIEALGLKVK